MSKKLYVGNLSWNVTEDDLKQLFATMGEVASVSIILDRDTGRSRGFGFVEMADDKGTKKAAERLNRKEFKGRRLVVNEAKPEGSSLAPREVTQEGNEITAFLEKFIDEEKVGERVGFSVGDKHFFLTRDK